MVEFGLTVAVPEALPAPVLKFVPVQTELAGEDQLSAVELPVTIVGGVAVRVTTGLADTITVALWGAPAPFIFEQVRVKVYVLTVLRIP